MTDVTNYAIPLQAKVPILKAKEPVKSKVGSQATQAAGRSKAKSKPVPALARSGCVCSI